MTRMRLVLLPLVLPLVAALCLAAAGCGDTTPGPGSDPGAGPDPAPGTSSPTDGTYVATDVTGRRLVPGSTLRLTLEGAQLSADAGCNGMSGRARFADGRLRVEGLGMTEMGCAPPLMDQDAWVADLLASGPTVERTGDGFTLVGDAVTVRFAPEPEPEPFPLEGTTWLLESTVEGDVATSRVPAPGRAVQIRIEGSTLTGSDGCNDLSGPVEVTPDRITADGDLVSTLRDCVRRDPAAPDLVGFLSGPNGVAYAVEGDRLTLTRDGTSLTFLADQRR